MALDLLTDEYLDGKIDRLYRHDLEAPIRPCIGYLFSMNKGRKLSTVMSELWNSGFIKFTLLNVATTTRITFSLTAVFAILMNVGIMSYFLRYGVDIREHDNNHLLMAREIEESNESSQTQYTDM